MAKYIPAYLANASAKAAAVFVSAALAAFVALPCANAAEPTNTAGSSLDETKAAVEKNAEAAYEKVQGLAAVLYEDGTLVLQKAKTEPEKAQPSESAGEAKDSKDAVDADGVSAKAPAKTEAQASEHGKVVSEYDAVQEKGLAKAMGFQPKAKGNAEVIADAQKDVKAIAVKGKLALPADASYFFAGFQNCEKIDGLAKLDTSKVEKMQYMFYKCSSVKSLDLSSFDTSKAKHMKGMFKGMRLLQDVKLGKDFSFTGAGEKQLCSLPVPDAKNIEGATGLWVDQDGIAMKPSDVPSNVEAYYTAEITVAADDPVSETDGEAQPNADAESNADADAGEDVSEAEGETIGSSTEPVDDEPAEFELPEEVVDLIKDCNVTADKMFSPKLEAKATTSAVNNLKNGHTSSANESEDDADNSEAGSEEETNEDNVTDDGDGTDESDETDEGDDEWLDDEEYDDEDSDFAETADDVMVLPLVIAAIVAAFAASLSLTFMRRAR